MPDPVRIVIPGPVVSYQKKVATWRAKDGRTGTLAYNSGNYGKWKPYARGRAAEIFAGQKVIEGPVIVDFLIYYLVPLAFSQKKRVAALRGDIRPATKPDIDNCIKAIADSVLTGIVIRDDRFIVGGSFAKWYADTARVEIVISQWPATAQNNQAALPLD